MTGTSWLDAFIFGLISAVSLPLGALVSFFWKPKTKVVAGLMAFGSGALLAALTIDLVAVAVDNGHFYMLALGCTLGGIFFFILNQIVNNKGGFLRKTGTSIMYLKKIRLGSLKNMTKKLSTITLFNHLPPSEIQLLVPYIFKMEYKKGKHLVHHDDPGDRMIIMETGKVKLIDEDSDTPVEIVENSVLGEIELLTGNKHEHSIIAETDVSVYVILKNDFDKLISQSEVLANEVKHFTEERIHILKEKQIISEEKAEAWYNNSIKHIEEKSQKITTSDIKETAKKHAGGAALAIFLGIFLDGIPESIVIGSNLILHATISLSLLMGLFLSNFPEALSSSVGLRQQNFSKFKILIMWTAIMVFTGIGAIAGNVLFANVEHGVFAFVDGLAAGAMLTMIAETMLPEAYHLGGSVTGLSTLAGFLVTILCKFI